MSEHALNMERLWRRSFLTTSICLRYLGTPFATIYRTYTFGGNAFTYLDVYIFGVRLARIHQI